MSQVYFELASVLNNQSLNFREFTVLLCCCRVAVGVLTPDKRQSKTLLPSTNADQNRQKQCFLLPFVASRATNDNRKLFLTFFIYARRLY